MECWDLVLCVLWLRLQHRGESTPAGQSVRRLYLNFLNYVNFQLSNPVVISICVNVTWVLWNGNLRGTMSRFKALSEYSSVPENGTCFLSNYLTRARPPLHLSNLLSESISSLCTNMFSIYHQRDSSGFLKRRCLRYWSTARQEDQHGAVEATRQKHKNHSVRYIYSIFTADGFSVRRSTLSLRQLDLIDQRRCWPELLLQSVDFNVSADRGTTRNSRVLHSEIIFLSVKSGASEREI